jgi:hypothetical protein
MSLVLENNKFKRERVKVVSVASNEKLRWIKKI